MQFLIRHRVAFIALLCLLVVPMAYAQGVPMDDVVGEALRQFRGQTLSDTILESAKRLFWALATISLVWTMGMLIVRQDIGELLMELIRFIILTGVFYWLLVNASTHQNGEGYVDAIVRSFLQLKNDNPSDMVMVHSGNGILSKGLLVFFEVVLGTEQGGETDRLVMSAIATLILGICAVIAAQFLLALVLAWVLGYAGIFLLGFGGSRWSSPIAVNYYKHVIAVGAVLLALGVVGSVAVSFLENLDFPSNKGEMSRYSYLGLMLGASILMMVLSLKVPQMLYTLITGSTLGLYAGSASAAGMAIATAGSSAYAVASGRFPGGGGGANGGVPSVPTAPSNGGSSRTESVMEAVQRSTSAAGSMSDPFHVGSTSDPFGVPRTADPHRTGGGGSVFGGTSSLASAVSTVGLAGGEGGTGTTVAAALRQATGGPGGDAVSRAFESDGSETLRGGPRGRSDGSVFPEIRRDDIPSFANKIDESSLTSSTASARDGASLSDGQILDDPAFDTRPVTDDSRAAAVTSLRSEDGMAMAAARDTKVTTASMAAAGGSADETRPLPGTFDGNDRHSTTAMAMATDDGTPLRARAPDTGASATSADHVIAGPHAESVSAVTTPVVAVDDADTRLTHAAPVAGDVHVPAHSETSTTPASIASADHVVAAPHAESVSAVTTPVVTVDDADTRLTHAAPVAGDVHVPAHTETTTSPASIASADRAVGASRADDASAPVPPGITVGGADTRVTHATPVAEHIRAPAHAQAHTPAGAVASAQHVGVASRTDSATNPGQPTVGIDGSDTRVLHATTGEVAAHSPARDDAASHGAAVSEDRDARAPVTVYATSAATASTSTTPEGSATVDGGPGVADASQLAPAADSHALSADHRGVQTAPEAFDPRDVAATPVQRKTHRDAIGTGGVAESQRDIEQVIEVADETHRHAARVTVATDVVHDTTQAPQREETAPSEPAARQFVATHTVATSPAPDDTAPRASSNDMRPASTQGTKGAAHDAHASTSVPILASGDDADRAQPRSANAQHAASELPPPEAPETEAGDDEPPAERP